jgi:hypothetical protein
VKFIADMGVSPRVVGWLCAAGHDAVILREQGLHRKRLDKMVVSSTASPGVHTEFRALLVRGPFLSRCHFAIGR